MSIDIISYLRGMLGYHKKLSGVSNINIGMLRGLGKTETLKSLIASALKKKPGAEIAIMIGNIAMEKQYMDLVRKGLRIIYPEDKLNFQGNTHVFSDEVYDAEERLAPYIESGLVVYEGGFFSSGLCPEEVAFCKQTGAKLNDDLKNLKKAIQDLLTGARHNVSEVLEMLEKLP